MKVMHLLESGRYSGAENVVCQIISMFQNDPNMEMVYCSRDGEVRKALEERRIRFVALDEFTPAEIKKVIKNEKPDIVHAHDMRAGFYAALSCGKTKLISHIHNNNFDSRGVSSKSLAYYYAALKAKHIFWVSQSSFDGYVFHKSLRRKSSVLYNVIDIDALYIKMEQDTNTYDYDVVYVGRLTYPKNPERLIDVMEQIVVKHPETKIAIIGTGDLEQNVRKLVLEKHLENNITMLGFNSNPLKIMRDAKVMLMTSRWEGTPMCALEAMSLGLPIVSTPADGLCDLIDNGVNGILSESNDVLAEAVCQVVRSAEVHKKFSENIMKKAQCMMDTSAYSEKIRNAYTK